MKVFPRSKLHMLTQLTSTIVQILTCEMECLGGTGLVRLWTWQPKCMQYRMRAGEIAPFWGRGGGRAGLGSSEAEAEANVEAEAEAEAEVEAEAEAEVVSMSMLMLQRPLLFTAHHKDTSKLPPQTH